MIIVIVISFLLLSLCLVLFMWAYFRKQNNHFNNRINEYEQSKSEMTKLVLHINDHIGEVKASLNRDLVQFSSNLHQQFSSFYERTNQRFESIEQRIETNLFQQKDLSIHQNKEMMEQLNELTTAQSELNHLSKQIVELQNVLQDKKARGIFGEVELYSLLESVFGGGEKRYLRQEKLSSGVVVDAMILGFSGLNNIAVDAKFPLENFRKMNDSSLTESESSLARKQFSKDVQKHIQDISQKYLIPEETAPFAFMFIPAEAIYAEIYANFSEIVDLSYQKRVYMVSPTTLMAYLTAIRSIYLQQHRDTHVGDILKELDILYKDLEKYVEKNRKLYSAFQSFSNAFIEEEKTAEKLKKRFIQLYEGEKNDVTE